MKIHDPVTDRVLMNVCTRSTAWASAFVSGADRIPVPGKANMYVRPDYIEAVYQRMDADGGDGRWEYRSVTVSGMRVTGRGKPLSAAGSVEFTTDGPDWVNQFVIAHMPASVTPAMRAIEVAYHLSTVDPESMEEATRLLTAVVEAMPEGMAYRVKSAAVMLAGTADGKWRREMGKGFHESGG